MRKLQNVPVSEFRRGGALVLLAVLPFLPGLPAWFGADDFVFLAHYRGHPAPPLPAFVASALTTLADTPTTFYRPLAFLSLGTELRWWGPSPAALRTTNLLLHTVTTLMVYATARRLARGPAAGSAALLAAATFTLFPRRVEPVMWLSCRPDLVAGAFAAAMLAVATRGVLTRERLAAALGLWALAVLGKEAAIGSVLVLVIVALIARPHEAGIGADDTGTRMAAVPAVAAACASAVVVIVLVRRAVLGAWGGGYGADALAWSPAGMMGAAGKYLAYLAIPPIEFFTPADMRSQAGTIAGLAGMATAGVLVGAILWRRREPAVQVGAAWLLVTAIPVVLPAISLTTPLNDRLLYLPGIGLALVAAGVLAHAPRLGRFAVLAVLVVYGAHEIRMVQRWPVAGELTRRIVRQLVEYEMAVESRDGGSDRHRIYVASVPDSYGGAYMLRNALPQALAIEGAKDPTRFVPLSLYFVDDPAMVPVTAGVISDFPDGAVACLDSVGRVEQVIPVMPAHPCVRMSMHYPADRFGRRQWIDVSIDGSGELVELRATSGALEVGRPRWVEPGACAGFAARLAESQVVRDPQEERREAACR